jgi:hypothetical protein
MGNKIFSTTDFYTICVLLATGHKAEKWSNDNEKMKRFSFVETPELQEVLLQHSNGKLVLSSLDLINAIENVKRMLRY